MSALSNVKTILSKVVTSFVSENGKIASYYIKASKKKIQKNTILYEVRDGQSIVDSPYAMFMHLVKDPEYAHFHHIWVINDLNYPTVKRIKAEFDNVEFVERNSKRYLLWLATAEYLINNATFQSFFLKREGQTYINTWHGTPLKYMGFDIPGNPAHSQNVVRNFLMADYILSPNSHTTEIFSKSYRLDGLFPGTILEGGYPRIDRTNTINRESIKKELKKLNLTYNDRLPTILYTPTWKGSSILNPSNDKEQIVKETIFLKEHFKDQYNVLVKVHPYIYRELSRDEEIRSILIPDYLDPNEVLSIVDLLITDYSSIFFDFLVTDKPIIFYVWDRDLYEVDRGMYLKESDLPGPAAETIDDLIRLIETKAYSIVQHRECYQLMKEKFSKYQDGKVTKRYIERIFNNKRTKRIEEVILRNDLNKLIIYPGGMKNNGISTSFINLTNNLDFNKYDVSIILNKPVSDEEISNLNKINENVRMLFRPGRTLYSRSEILRDLFIQAFTSKKVWRFVLPKQAYKREATRIVGNVHFDTAIDFSGYSFFWAKTIAFMNSGKKIIFQHNDLLSDSKKIINGKAPHKKNLPAVFSIYYLYDRILSVSKETMEVNRRNLRRFIKDEQLGFTINTIDTRKILNDDFVSKDHNIVSNEVVEFRYNARIKKEGFYKVAKNLVSLKDNSFFNILISEKDTIFVIASTRVNVKEYVKITLNGLYTGWIDGKDVDPINHMIELDTVVDKCSSIATVNCDNDAMIFKSLNNLTEFRSPLKMLDKTYVYISKRIIFNDQGFCFIENNSGEVGWVDQSSLSNFHDTKGLNFLKNYFLRKNKSKNINLYDSFAMEFVIGTVAKNPIVASLTPEIDSEGEHLVLENQKGRVISFSKQARIADKIYYCTNDFNNQSLWVEEDDLIGISDIQSNEYNFNKSYRNEYTDINQRTETELPQTLDNYFNLVNMGRLSPEKNQISLIKAVKTVLGKQPNIRLFILGDGPLKNEMRQLILSLDLEKNVFLLGHQENPFTIMKQCDLFVFPSIYEGQPMVLLEALTLKLPVLATNIPANLSVLKDYASEYIEGFSSEDISSALLKKINNLEMNLSFNPEEYNDKALKNFYTEVN